jgi:hypothetical protein
MEERIKDLLNSKNPVIKIVIYFAAIYFIYQLGKAVGEFIYYISR